MNCLLCLTQTMLQLLNGLTMMLIQLFQVVFLVQQVSQLIATVVAIQGKERKKYVC